jgi:hypothetical protein
MFGIPDGSGGTAKSSHPHSDAGFFRASNFATPAESDSSNVWRGHYCPRIQTLLVRAGLLGAVWKSGALAPRESVPWIDAALKGRSTR